MLVLQKKWNRSIIRRKLLMGGYKFANILHSFTSKNTVRIGIDEENVKTFCGIVWYQQKLYITKIVEAPY